MQENNNHGKFSANKNTFVFALTIIACTILIVYIFFNFTEFKEVISKIASTFTPIAIGAVMAYILNTVLNLYEKHIFKKLNQKYGEGSIWSKIKRPITLILSYATIIAIFAAVLIVIIPKFGNSLADFAADAAITIPILINNIYFTLEDFVIENNINLDISSIQAFFFDNFNVTTILQNFSERASDVFTQIMDATMNIFTAIFTAVMSIIYSLYFLLGKESIIIKLKKILYAYLPRRIANKTSMVLTLSNRIFSDYVRVQATECVILGALCYIGMLFINVEYSVLIAIVVAVFALIPLIGAIIGAAFGVILLLIVDPISAFAFLVFFLILQQFENNVIYPKVVGSSLGLPGILTLASVTIMGGLIGIVGVLIGPPFFAVIYALIKFNANQRLSKNQIDSEVLNGSEVRVIYKDILEPKTEKEKKKTSKNFTTKIKKLFKK